MDELSSIAEVLLASIEVKMETTPSIFKLWFNEFKLASLTDNQAIFTTPSAIKKNILSTKYNKIICETLEETIGFAVDVVVLTHEEYTGEAPKPDINHPVVAPYEEDTTERKSRDEE